MMTLIVKAIVILLLISILYALGSALYYLVRGGDKKNGDQIVKALTWRIGLSVVLFLLLLFAYALGWIAPHTF